MIFLGTASSPEIRARMRTDPLLGAMLTPGQKYPVRTMAGITWAADNECFSKGPDYDFDRWASWIDTRDRETCLFAVAPDVYDPTGAPCHDATLARSLPILPLIADLGYRPAFVAQAGSCPDSIPWDQIDAVFFGGDTAWKLGPMPRAITRRAHRLGKWVHMGRVNSWKRLRYARWIGCDSVDGTYLKFGPDLNLPKLTARLDEVDRQAFLFGSE